ncbi:MAG: GtrA family protein [bacterium]|nr:GtrA family protein [bacterium]
MSENKNLWQMIKFTLFSISAGVIQEGLYLVLFNALGLSYWFSYLVSLVASVLWNFTFNRRYTFRSDADVKRSMLLVALFYVVFTPVTMLGGQWLVNHGLNGNVVQIGTMLLNFVLEFLYQRFVVYRGRIDTNDVARRAERRKQGA